MCAHFLHPPSPGCSPPFLGLTTFRQAWFDFSPLFCRHRGSSSRPTRPWDRPTGLGPSPESQPCLRTPRSVEGESHRTFTNLLRAGRDSVLHQRSTAIVRESHLSFFFLPAQLKDIADKYKKSPAQICIKYQAQRGVVVIPKSVTESRIKVGGSVDNGGLSCLGRGL